MGLIGRVEGIIRNVQLKKALRDFIETEKRKSMPTTVKEKRIDIIIPTYNGSYNLIKLLESISKQNYYNYN